MTILRKKLKWLFNPLAITTFLVIILGGVFLGSKYRPQPKKKKLPWEKIKSIRLENKEKKVVLQKENGHWLVVNHPSLPADKNKIGSLITALKKIDQKQLVSQNRKNFSLFGVEKDWPRITLQFDQGAEISFVVGHYSYNRQGTYLRFPDQEKVFLIESDLENTANPSKKWENLRLLEGVSFSNKKVEIVRKNKPAQILSKKEKEKLLSLLDYLEGKAVFPWEKQKKLQKRLVFSLVLTDKNEQKTKINFYQEGKKLWAAKEKDEFVYRLSEEKSQEIEAIVRKLPS